MNIQRTRIIQRTRPIARPRSTALLFAVGVLALGLGLGSAASAQTTAGTGAPATGSVTFDTASGPVTVTSHVGNAISSDYTVDFAALDADGDGQISRAEASGNASLSAEFHVVDIDRNGRLSRVELSGWID